MFLVLVLICVYDFCCVHKLISCFKTEVYSFTLYSCYSLRLMVHNKKGRIILKTPAILHLNYVLGLLMTLQTTQKSLKSGQISTSVGRC